MKLGSFVAADEVHLSHRERSDRISDAIRVRGYGLSMELRPLTRFALSDASHRLGQIDLSPMGRGGPQSWTGRLSKDSSYASRRW